MKYKWRQAREVGEGPANKRTKEAGSTFSPVRCFTFCLLYLVSYFMFLLLFFCSVDLLTSFSHKSFAVFWETLCSRLCLGVWQWFMAEPSWWLRLGALSSAPCPRSGCRGQCPPGRLCCHTELLLTAHCLVAVTLLDTRAFSGQGSSSYFCFLPIKHLETNNLTLCCSWLNNPTDLSTDRQSGWTLPLSYAFIGILKLFFQF